MGIDTGIRLEFWTKKENDEFRMTNVECRMSKESLKFDLEERLIEFGVRIIRLAEALPKTRVGNHISGQIIRSGTSPTAKFRQ